MNLEQIETNVAGKQQITLRAVFGKQQGKLTVYPMQVGDTGKMVGVENLSEEEKRTVKRLVTPETSRIIEDGSTFDLSDETDKTDWEWIKVLPEIVESREKAHEEPRALFYIEDLDRDIQVRIKKADLIFQALKLVSESSDFKKNEICRLMGQDTRYFRPIDVEEYLKERAMNNPAELIQKYNDRYYKVRLFLYRLLDAKIIKKDGNNIYKYGEIILGVNEDAALHWLSDSNNAQFVRQWQMQLNPDPLPSVDPSQFDDQGDLVKADNKKAESAGNSEPDSELKQEKYDEGEPDPKAQEDQEGQEIQEEGQRKGRKGKNKS